MKLHHWVFYLYCFLISIPLFSQSLSLVDHEVYPENTEEEKHPLFKAIKNGDLSKACSLLSKGVDPNTILEDGLTALHITKKPQMLELLLEHGADVNATDDFNETALLNCAYDADIELIKLLLQYKADPNVPNKNDYTPLLICLELNSEVETRAEITKLLLKHGADPNVCTRFTRTTPLYTAVKTENIKAVFYLLEAGANYSGVQGEIGSPLDLAITLENQELSGLLMGYGAQHYKLKGDLLQALYEQDVKTIESIVLQSIDLNFYFDEIGLSPLLVSIKYLDAPMISELFLNHGAKTELIDTTTQQTALHLAIEEECPVGLIAKLLEAGVSVNHLDNKSQSALMLAVEVGNEKIVNLLLNHNADPNLTNENGFTAQEIAILAGFPELAQLLFITN